MRRMVIGLGNSFRGDDGVGLEAASRVRNVETHLRPSGCLDLIDLWEDADEVVVIDAMRSGRPPGQVARFEPLVEPMEATEGFGSTHGLGLLEAIRMATEVGRLPKRLVVFGIEAADVSPGMQLTPPVMAAAARVAEEIDHA